MLSKFLDPKNDAAFKRIFGTERNKDILIHFLNDIIVFPGNRRILDVTFLKTIQDPEVKAQKTSLVDVLCQDEAGSRYIVEMQVAKDRHFIKRAQYYASKVYTSQIQRDQNFGELKEVIFLGILDFMMFPNKKGYKSDHVILDKESYENDLKDFSFTFIELPKFKKSMEELSNMMEKWIYFFQHADETSEAGVKKFIGEDLIIERAYEELNRFNWNESQLFTYEDADMQEKVYNSVMATSYEDGFEKGEAQGFEKGKAQGIEKGRALAMAEQREKLILNMLQQGIQEEAICTIASISLTDLKQLGTRLLKKG